MKKEGSDSFIDLIKNEYFVHWVVSPSEESTHFWKNWIINHPGRKADVEKARQFIQSAGYKVDEQMPENDYAAVLENIVHYSQARKKRKFDFRFVHWKPLAAAASILLVVFFGVSVSRHVSRDEPALVEAPQTINKQNPRGQKSTIMLPDGTKVVLNSESSISYHTNFTGSERRVRLAGEAFFEVIRDPSKPFVVETENLLTTALGTSFNVDAYPDQPEEVTLVTGKVRVNKSNDASDTEILLPGEKAAFSNGLINKYSHVNMDHIKWKDGVIVFQQTPFHEGVQELERWYGVTIEVRNIPENTDINLNGFFENNSLSNVLESMSYSMQFDFQINGKEILITFK